MLVIVSSQRQASDADMMDQFICGIVQSTEHKRTQVQRQMESCYYVYINRNYNKNPGPI